VVFFFQSTRLENVLHLIEQFFADDRLEVSS